MKLLLIILIILGLTGCSIDNSLGIDQPPLDLAAETLDFNHSGPIGGYSQEYPIGGYGNNLFYKLQIDQNQGYTSGSLLFKMVNNKPEIINDDISSICTFNNFTNCSGFLDINTSSYSYNNKFYLVTSLVDRETDVNESIVYESNSSLGNRKEIYRDSRKIVLDTAMIPATYYFHDNKMIIMNENYIVMLDLETYEEQILFNQEQSKIYFSTIFNNQLYFNSSNYLNAEGVLENYINLSVDLETKDIGEVYPELISFGQEPTICLITENYVLFYITEGEKLMLKSYDIPNEKLYDIDEFGFIQYNFNFSPDRFIINKIGAGEEANSTILYDFTGKKYDSYESNNGESFFGGLVSDDGEYVTSSSEANNLVIYKRTIKSDKFGKETIITDIGLGDK